MKNRWQSCLFPELPMKESVKYLLAVGLLLLLLPFLLTVMLSGKDAVEVSKNIDLEMLLPSVLYREIPDDARDEMIRAQAVLIRSRLYLRIQNGEAASVLKENRDYEASRFMDAERMERCRQAAADTEGMVLTYAGQVVEGPFCACSSGKTRDGMEVMGLEEYAWLVSVDSAVDVESPEYLSGVLFSPEELWKKLSDATGDLSLKAEEIFGQISIAARDSAGYVTEVQIGESRMSGEAFRKLLELPSACFSIQELDGNIRFLCQGAGHGLGMSQYGANALAEEGKTWKEILTCYFPKTEVKLRV